MMHFSNVMLASVLLACSVGFSSILADDPVISQENCQKGLDLTNFNASYRVIYWDGAKKMQISYEAKEIKVSAIESKLWQREGENFTYIRVAVNSETVLNMRQDFRLNNSTTTFACQDADPNDVKLWEKFSFEQLLKGIRLEYWVKKAGSDCWFYDLDKICFVKKGEAAEAKCVFDHALRKDPETEAFTTLESLDYENNELLAADAFSANDKPFDALCDLKKAPQLLYEFKMKPQTIFSKKDLDSGLLERIVISPHGVEAYLNDKRSFRAVYIAMTATNYTLSIKPGEQETCNKSRLAWLDEDKPEKTDLVAATAYLERTIAERLFGFYQMPLIQIGWTLLPNENKQLIKYKRMQGQLAGRTYTLLYDETGTLDLPIVQMAFWQPINLLQSQLFGYSFQARTEQEVRKLRDITKSVPMYLCEKDFGDIFRIAFQVKYDEKLIQDDYVNADSSVQASLRMKLADALGFHDQISLYRFSYPRVVYKDTFMDVTFDMYTALPVTDLFNTYPSTTVTTDFFRMEVVDDVDSCQLACYLQPVCQAIVFDVTLKQCKFYKSVNNKLDSQPLSYYAKMLNKDLLRQLSSGQMFQRLFHTKVVEEIEISLDFFTSDRDPSFLKHKVVSQLAVDSYQQTMESKKIIQRFYQDAIKDQMFSTLVLLTQPKSNFECALAVERLIEVNRIGYAFDLANSLCYVGFGPMRYRSTEDPKSLQVFLFDALKHFKIQPEEGQYTLSQLQDKKYYWTLDKRDNISDLASCMLACFKREQPRCLAVFYDQLDVCILSSSYRPPVSARGVRGVPARFGAGPDQDNAFSMFRMEAKGLFMQRPTLRASIKQLQSELQQIDLPKTDQDVPYEEFLTRYENNSMVNSGLLYCSGLVGDLKTAFVMPSYAKFVISHPDSDTTPDKDQVCVPFTLEQYARTRVETITLQNERETFSGEPKGKILGLCFGLTFVGIVLGAIFVVVRKNRN